MSRIFSIASKWLLGCGILLGTSAAANAVPYQFFKVAPSCPNFFCAIKFPNVPAGKRLVIERVSCLARIDADGAAKLHYIALQVRNPNNTLRTSVALEPGEERFHSAGGQSQNIFDVNDEVYAFATAGGYVQAQIGVFDGVGQILQFECAIGGELI